MPSESGNHIDPGSKSLSAESHQLVHPGSQRLSKMSKFQLHDAIVKREDGNPYLSSRGMQGLVVSVVFTSLAASFVGIRLYTRLKFLRRLEANDWMVVVALVSYPFG